MQNENTDPALALARANGLVRARELAKVGAAGEKLQQLLRSGDLVRLSRGLYALAERKGSELDYLAQIAIRYPHAVFCLLTALQLHGLTTQTPPEVWLAVGPKARTPAADYPPLHVVRASDLEHGVVQMAADGVVQLPVTSIARTVADCFKFRNKIGLDVALEALRDAWRNKKVNMDELWSSAQSARVANVMRPYLESLE